MTEQELVEELERAGIPVFFEGEELRPAAPSIRAMAMIDPQDEFLTEYLAMLLHGDGGEIDQDKAQAAMESLHRLTSNTNRIVIALSRGMNIMPVP